MSCTGGVFFIDNLPNDATVFWTSSNVSIATVVNSNNQGEVSRVSGNNGDVVIKATVSLPCGTTFVETKKISIGKPDRPRFLDMYGNEVTSISTCVYLHEKLCMDTGNNGEILEWEWKTVVGNFNVIDFGQCTQILGFQPSSGFISVRFRNACGWSKPTFITVNITECNKFYRKQKLIRVFPNPATNNITLSVANQKTEKPVKNNDFLIGIKEVEIYDYAGRLKYYRKYPKHQSVNIDVSSLQEGIYLMKINTGNEIESQQLIIQN